ncbi:hypothetical protein FHS11_000940 [Mucilaginibacter gotjawali]|uniref:Uncharacterized protein n=1 Tax=Mucilaginibacter gotjawali TaxID=1550579 RepID=A0A839SC91_9SPHI|nr:hypothetical protein [Mucilaginibacter gotjawali]
MISIFFLCHRYQSPFFQAFFLRRCASHKMFKMNGFWERTFYLATFILQGFSFLKSRAYTITHWLPIIRLRKA